LGPGDWRVDHVVGEKAFGQFRRESQGCVIKGQGVGVEIFAFLRVAIEERPDRPVTVADTTAILKFIETRFNVPPLNKRDAAQMEMTQFFDFSEPVWLIHPTPPAQNTNGACYLDHLP
jgi:hypothetical protein